MDFEHVGRKGGGGVGAPAVVFHAGNPECARIDLSAKEFPSVDQGMLIHTKKYVALGGTRASDPPSDVSKVAWLLELSGKKKFDPFLNPSEQQLIDVPDEFANVGQYCSVIAHNMLVEFWHKFQQGARAGNFCCRVQGATQLYIEDCDTDHGMKHSLLRIAGSLHIVTAQKIAGRDKLWLTITPKLAPELSAQESMEIESFGYIGAYVAELAALVELASRRIYDPTSNVLKSILCPRLNFPGEFEKRALSANVPINESQRQAVNGLKYALEKIQGPPGNVHIRACTHVNIRIYNQSEIEYVGETLLRTQQREARSLECAIVTVPQDHFSASLSHSLSLSRAPARARALSLPLCAHSSASNWQQSSLISHSLDRHWKECNDFPFHQFAGPCW